MARSLLLSSNEIGDHTMRGHELRKESERLREESARLRDDLDALIVASYKERRLSKTILRAIKELASEEDCWRRSNGGRANRA